MRKRIINRSRVSAFVLVSTLMTGISPLANASCEPNAVKGTWIANGTYWTPVFDVVPTVGWVTCKLEINSSGKLRTSKESSCKDENGTKSVVKSGKFEVQNNCRVKGVIRFGSGNNIELSGGQMSESTDQISALGTFTDNRQQYSLLMTKRP
mgnify:FL=1